MHPTGFGDLRVEDFLGPWSLVLALGPAQHPQALPNLCSYNHLIIASDQPSSLQVGGGVAWCSWAYVLAMILQGATCCTSAGSCAPSLDHEGKPARAFSSPGSALGPQMKGFYRILINGPLGCKMETQMETAC